MKNTKITCWKKGIRLLILVASLAYILFFFIRNKNTLQITFSMDAKTLSAILVLQGVFLVLQSWRFQIILEKCAGIRLPFLQWMKIFILGRFLNMIFSQLGNIYRGMRVKQDYGISYTRYISSFASMTWMDTLMNLLIALLAVGLLEPGLQIGPRAAWKLLLALFLLILLVPVILNAIFQRITLSRPSLQWLHGKLSEVLSVTLNNLRDLRFLAKIFGLVILLFLRTILVFHLYWSILGISVSPAALAIFYTLFKFSFFVVLTPGNLGIQEIAWGYLSEQMNIGMGQGILMSGFVRVVSSLVLIVLGLALGGADLIRQRKKYLARASDNNSFSNNHDTGGLN